MDRRQFVHVSVAGLAGLALGEKGVSAEARRKKSAGESYNVVIVGDTHYDALPDTIYHTGYSDKDPKREANHRKEFVRNAEMWESRCPRLVKRAACLADDDTRMFLQMGDLIQGDTGDAANHMKMLDDAYSMLKTAFGPLPLVTVAGNHDMRGTDDAVARQAYIDYMMPKMSSELGKDITKTTYAFTLGGDAYIVIDFNKPDDEEIERLLKETSGARYTFIVIHGPVFPYDSPKYYNWILHGRDHKDEARRHFRELFAQRNAIVLCGHTHNTEFADWYGDGGRITQMTMHSVWAREELGRYNVLAEGPEQYGTLSALKQEKAAPLFEEYRPGLKRYSFSRAAGSYKLKVSDEGVFVDFYAGDSTQRSERFILR